MTTLITQTEEYVNLNINGTTVSVTLHPCGELDFYLGDNTSDVILQDDELLDLAFDWVLNNISGDDCE